MLKTLARKAAALAGAELIPRWRLADLPLARRLHETFDRLAITSVLDIGANRGQYRDFLRSRVGFAGRIHSFEPDPDLAAYLAGRAAREDARWHIHPHALGAVAETRQFNRMHASDFNSFRAPRADAPANMLDLNRMIGSFPVEVVPLDRLADTLGDLRHCYAKIDTQGFDLEVLAGGPASFACIPALQTEVSLVPIYDGMPDWQQSMAAFTAAGFAVADLFRVSTDDCGRAVEFDCVMLRA